MAEKKGPAVTKLSLLSPTAYHAFTVAEYRLRKNANYAGLSNEQKWAYCMEKAFDAALSEETYVAPVDPQHIGHKGK